MDFKREKTILDIDNSELKELEEILYSNRILLYDKKYYISNSDIDILKEDYDKITKSYPLNYSRIGRNFYPTQMFELLKIVFYHLQLKKSDYDLYILRDPAGIDDSNLLDDALVQDSALHCIAKKLGLGISTEEIYIYQLSSEKDIKNKIAEDRYRKESFNVLFVLDSILSKLERMIKTFIIPCVNMEKLKNGYIYCMSFNKGLTELKCLGNVIEIRYKNIIKINRSKIGSDRENRMIKEDMEEMEFNNGMYLRLDK